MNSINSKDYVFALMLTAVVKQITYCQNKYYLKPCDSIQTHTKKDNLTKCDTNV